MFKYGLKISLMVAVAAASILNLNTPSQAAGHQVGDVIGEVLKTDIAAYVNGKPISSMNIDGYTAVAVEDLRSYGFEVAWMPYSRKLMITDDTQSVASGLPAGSSSASGPVGSKLSDVLYTDIEAFYNGHKVQSFNMNGRTAIVLNDLDSYGNVVWQPEQRVITYVSAGYQAGSSNDSATKTAEKQALQLRQTDAVHFTVDFHDEQLMVNGKQVGFGKEGLPYFDVRYFAERFGYSITSSGSRYTLDNGRYSFTINTANMTTEMYWGDRLEKSVQAYIQPFVKDNVLYAYSIDLERWFGYKGIWNQEERKLDISYSRYEVEDFGLPATTEQDELELKVPVWEKENRGFYSVPLSISLDNGGIFGNGLRAANSPAEPAADGMYASSLDCTIRLGPGNNPISEKILVGERIVYQSQYHVRASFETVPLGFRSKGFSLERESSSTVHRTDPKFELKGTAPVPGFGDFRVMVHKWEDGKGFGKQAVQQLDIHLDDQGAFTMPIDLTDGGSGIYQVRILTTRTVPRTGVIYQEADHFYIKLE